MDYNFTPITRPLRNISKTKLEKVSGITVHLLPECHGDFTAYNTGFMEISKANSDHVDVGYHYGIDGKDIVEYIPDEYIAKSVKDGSTYISAALFGQKPENHCISICLFINPKDDYEKTEVFLVRFIVQLLRKYKLTADSLWRGFDLSKNNKDPLHMLDESIWKKYLNIIIKYLEATDDKLSEDEQNEVDEKIVFDSPYKYSAEKEELSINEYINKFYDDNKNKIDAFAKKYKPFDKGLDEIKNYVPSVSDSEIQNGDYLTGNYVQFKVTQTPPSGTCSCEEAFDRFDAVETAQETVVEPIYPDLVTPPGEDITIANGNSDAATQSSSNTPLTIEEFEKRQKTFSLDNFTDLKKETIGRPINTEDPFPVDNQIKKLEEHFPKVKVDKITFDYSEDNHLGSEIGQAIAKNYNMTYDMLTEISKRTEQRLVKIENNLATVMRNLFRMSSRVNINCVYYGGQSVYGKYNCIRCMQDDRVNDGAIVSMDQCLSCTRYEPVIGQVYAILDEAGSNVSQVIDDMQMSYMSLERYKTFNKVEEMHTDMQFANLQENSPEEPTPFINDKWKDTKEELEAKGIDPENIPDGYRNGFVMDWNPTILETHSPAINEYKLEFKDLNKTDQTVENQGFNRELFVDTRESALEYERFEFNVKDYVIGGFSNSSSPNGSNNNFGMGATEVRQKIVDYALKAVELCEQGKAGYSQAYRSNHLDSAINGISYWDCSSLVAAAYNSAGIAEVQGNTASIYPLCTNKQGGKLMLVSQVKDALAGDMIWCCNAPNPTTEEELQTIDSSTAKIFHVGIYIGEGKYAHASTDDAPLVEQIKVSPIPGWDRIFAIGRPKSLIELDKQASQGVAGAGHWDKDLHGISDELWNASSVAESNSKGFIDNMNKYGYKDVLVKVAKEKGFDPYFIAAICAIESSGNPMCGGNYPGIMQCAPPKGFATSTLDGIEQNIRNGCDDLANKASWLKRNGWNESNLHLLTTAHNSGQYGTTDALGHSNETYPNVAIPMMGKKVDLATCKIPEVGQLMYDYTKTYQKSWNAEEKKTYATKILRAYCILYNKKVLG